MATIYARIGDTIIVSGLTKTRDPDNIECELIEHFPADSSGVIAGLRPKAIPCAGCGENDVDEEGDFCSGCVMVAMQVIAIRDACNHLLNTRTEISRVITHDNAEMDAARNAGQQYVDIRSAAHDYIMSESHETRAGIVRMFADDIAGVMSESLFGWDSPDI